MPERHTVDFIRGSFNVVSDAERKTITLQFERSGDGRKPVSPPIGRVLKAIERRYGERVMSRLNRWRTAESNPFVLPSSSKPHPENPDVLCFEIGVKQSVGMDVALATVLRFLQQQPEYQRTFGPPLDRDQVPSRVRKGGTGDASTAAQDVFRRMLERRRSVSSERQT